MALKPTLQLEITRGSESKTFVVGTEFVNSVGPEHQDDLLISAVLRDDIAAWGIGQVGVNIGRKVDQGVAVIHGLIVMWAFRKRGVGPLLMDEAERFAAQRGFKLVELSTTENRLRDWYSQELGYDVIQQMEEDELGGPAVALGMSGNWIMHSKGSWLLRKTLT